MPLKDKLRSRSAAELREERDLLGWVRQPEVRWMDPSLLIKAGVEVVVSGTFGKFADKREVQQLEPQGAFDHSTAAELWLDYLSDTGDGWEATYTMAYLLAQPGLEIGGVTLPRGNVLLLGGDQVYPSAEPETYEDRFKGPFRAALPQSDPGSEPHMYATPGNHDWYDGLSSFLRLFCARRWIGGWTTSQRRSYFALQLPHNWWVWAIDIQLDTYLDEPQLEYFSDLPLATDAKVILLTAKPSWTKAHDGRVEPVSWRYLSFFEERMVRDRGARLVLTITGDTHHYARYEPDGDGAAEAPTRITAGGGGAYLSATHTLREKLELRPLGKEAASGAFEQRPVVTYRRDQIYPRPDDSKRLGKAIVKLASLNPGFGRLIGGFHVLLAASILGSLSAGESRLTDVVTDDVGAFLGSSASGLPIVLAIVLFGGIVGGTDIKPWPDEARSGAIKLLRWVVAALHTLVHLLIVVGIVWGAVKLAPDIGELLAVLFALAGAYAAGALLGPTVWGLFLLAVHRWRRFKAPEAANQVFSGQSIADYKNFLRIRLARDGGLTIFPLGVDRVGREWDHVAGEGPGPRFVPRRGEPAVGLIDGPLQFDRAGNRAR
ncbi:MAG: metallophosphoesterase [Actinomycetota bacterium]|nr:metallophosphoesterase [Actinomycetota bacterium]